MKKMTILAVVAAISGLIAFGGGQTALATTTCTFTTVGTTMTLDGDCTTDATILIPDGYTLDGAGYAITAVDPSGGHFLGAVVKNAGPTAHVTDLTVTASGLTNVCDEGADRLRGILFDGASGSITDNTVNSVNQGVSGCQEGNGIEVRNAPFDGTGTSPVVVAISGNVVTGYQKNGITANGNVNTTIIDNTVTAAPVNYIAQNGIQFGWWARGLARGNFINGNWYEGAGWTATGLLLFNVRADQVKHSRNMYRDNQRNLVVVTDQACEGLYGGFYGDYGLCQ